MIPLVDLAAQHRAIKDEVAAAIAHVLESSHFVLGDEVAAFEELVGSHGGLGGLQTQPFLLYPAMLPHDLTRPIVGTVALHQVLKGWVRDARHADETPALSPQPATDRTLPQPP